MEFIAIKRAPQHFGNLTIEYLFVKFEYILLESSCVVAAHYDLESDLVCKKYP